jgi:phage gpG-like protein
MPPIGLRFPSGRTGWEPDPIVVAEDINLADARLKRFRVPLNQARFVIREDIQSHFDEQSDPDGIPWQEWSESYASRGARDNLGEILQRTYALEYAATNPENFIVISHSQSAGAFGAGEVALVGSNLPDYWIWHEEGVPDRVGPRGPNPLPKRSFMGLSDEAEAAIYAVFDAHVDRALTGTLVTGQPQVAGGRFGRKFF